MKVIRTISDIGAPYTSIYFEQSLNLEQMISLEGESTGLSAYDYSRYFS